MRLILYIHIPFCVQKCAYCDFLSFPAERTTQRRYVDALCREIRTASHAFAGQESCSAAQNEQDHTDPAAGVCSIFFGGGTPSVLPAAWITEILSEIRKGFDVAADAEITIEANPGTVDLEILQSYRAAGFNRISFGAQSFHDEELRTLGRIHTREEIRRSVATAREAGFTNSNLDLMYGLPGQTLSSWEDTLRQAIALGPEHISAYSLILEEGTPFHTQYAATRAQELPTEEEERAMTERAGELLGAAGYRQYEISNYAKEGYACRHNIGYWTGVPYLGCGLGAASYMPASAAVAQGLSAEAKEGDWLRWNNPRDLKAYIEGQYKKEEVQRLGEADRMAEFLILGLRMTEGVEDAGFARRFGRSLDDVYGEVLQKYTASGHLCREEGRTFFSPQGVAVSNAILVDFLP